MSLNVNYSALYKQGLDTSILKEVSNEILERAAKKSSQYQNTVTPSGQITAAPKPAQIGTDLYNGRLNSDLARQIAMNNTMQFEFNSKTIQALQFINSQAAQTKNVDGKYMPSVSNIINDVKQPETNNYSRFQGIITSETSKDKDGSNPFYHGEFLMEEKDSNNNANAGDSLKSIFA